MGKYGSFENDYTEYRVETVDPVHVIDNYIWNEKVYASTTQTATGYLSYDHSGREITNVTYAANDCEQAYEKYYNRLIYVRDNKSGCVWNVNWEPVLEKIDDYNCVHGLGFTKLYACKNNVAAEMLVFIPPGKDALEVWSLKIGDLSGRTRDISVFVCNQISLKSTFTYGEGIYIKGSWRKDINGVFVQKDCEFLPHNVHAAFLVCDRKVAAYDCSREGFFGAYGTFARPEAVFTGTCHNSTATGERPITALQLDITLKKRSTFKADFLFGIAKNITAVKRYREKYFASGRIRKAFDKLKKDRQKMIRKNFVNTPDEKLNMLMNIWYKQQIEFGAVWCRWGFRGYRDIVQHNMGRTFFDPEAAAKPLLKALGHQYSDGSALRGWSPIDAKPYADSSLWLIYSVVKHLKESGDFQFLKCKVKFYDAGSATVFEHLLRATDFSWKNRGKDGLCLIKFGDWNDSLTRVGTKGKGQSVWLTMALGRALVEMKELAGYLGDKKLASSLAKKHKSVVKAVNSAAWEGDRYIRCIDDNGKAVGSKRNKKAGIFLNTQSWGALSYVANRQKFTKALDTADRKLLTKLGYKLLDPAFTKFDPNIGRISSMQPGIAENGTIYSHGNAFMMLACLQMALPDKAYDIFQRAMSCYEKVPQQVTGAVPFTVPNCYNGPEHLTHPFRVEYSWITGSVSWFYLSVLEWLLGARSEFAGLRIDPRLPRSWKGCFVSRHFRGRVFDITIRRRKSVNGVKVILNGKELDGTLIDPKLCKKRNVVEVFVE
jgi:cellobiose phosphorylase